MFLKKFPEYTTDSLLCSSIYPTSESGKQGPKDWSRSGSRNTDSL